MGIYILLLNSAIIVMLSYGIYKHVIIDSTKVSLRNLNASQSVVVLDKKNIEISRGKAILNKLKGWGKLIQGKTPLYTSSGGTQIKVDSFGDEKSIELFKRF